MSNTSAQHSLGLWSSTPNHEPVPGIKITKCILVVTPLAFWACDWSILPMETLLREYSLAAMKLSNIDRSAVAKGLGKTALVYIFQTIIVDKKRLLATPTAFSVMCSSWKTRPIFLNPLQTSWELMRKGDFKLWWFPVRSHISTNKNSQFLDLWKVTTFVWYPTIVAEKLGYLNKWRYFDVPYFTSTPKTPSVDWPLIFTIVDHVVKGFLARWSGSEVATDTDWQTTYPET